MTREFDNGLVIMEQDYFMVDTEMWLATFDCDLTEYYKGLIARMVGPDPLDHEARRATHVITDTLCKRMEANTTAEDFMQGNTMDYDTPFQSDFSYLIVRKFKSGSDGGRWGWLTFIWQEGRDAWLHLVIYTDTLEQAYEILSPQVYMSCDECREVWDAESGSSSKFHNPWDEQSAVTYEPIKDGELVCPSGHKNVTSLAVHQG